MSEHPSKQKIVDKLKDSDTVLVTVSSNPSVDELSAALGFTLLLNKMNKHATAVFSGDVPPAITFLDPEKTFENTVDSLRDFIIALDKERADHLRYKVEGDMVKIFITPYRTTIGRDDFEFSQGDYNVEMVVAIGVEAEDDLDRALSEHGRILHDATVASLSVGENKSQLGTIQWHDDKASSYSEMLVSIAESLKGSKNPIDEQIATAFLTGIVAATERFSNTKTTSNAMTMAATLMAAGANQQLIATKLEEAQEAAADDDQSSGSPEPDDGDQDDNATSSNDNSGDSSMLKVQRDEDAAPRQQQQSSNKQNPRKRRKKNQQSQQQGPQNLPKPTPVMDKPAADGSMSISHEKQGSVDEVAEQVAREQQEQAAEHAEAQLASSLSGGNKSVPSVADLKKDLERASEEIDDAADGVSDSDTPSEPELVLPAPVTVPSPAIAPDVDADGPRIGGTLNATTEQAAEDKRRELASDRNKTILSHDTGGYLETERKSDAWNASAHNQTVSMTAQNDKPNDTDEEPRDGLQRGKTIMPPSAQPAPTQPPESNESAPAEPAESLTLADIDAKNRGQDVARSEIEQALEQGSGAASASATPAAESLPPLPPMPDFSTLPELPPSAQDGPGGFIPTPLPDAPSHQPAAVEQSKPQSPFNQPEPAPVSQPPAAVASSQLAPTQPANQAQFQPPAGVGAQAQHEQSLADNLGSILPPAQPEQPRPAAQPQASQDPAQFQLPS